MPVWLIIVLALVGLFLIFWWLGTKESKQAGKKAEKILKNIEQKYDDYLQRKIDHQVLKHENFDLDRDKAFREVMVLLKPDIQSLISLINATIYSDTRTEYQAQYFSNIPHITNEMFEKSTKRKNDSLTKEDEEKIYAAFETAVRSDITNRISRLSSSW